ncbi:hypothetical protein ACFROC_21940 [Nocardia tengchongensis]|uniref:hypothetical protein n=1 Tax=Nocardia tengchongensis TaxID=2055889 RepID=UPI0036CEF97C
MTSANKQYSLGFKDGNLVLTSADGRTLWESSTAAGKAQGEGLAAHAADKFSMRLNLDGTMDVLADGKHVWSLETPSANAAKLVVGDDGSLQIQDIHGQAVSTLVGKDTIKHPYLVQLQPPLGAAKMKWLVTYIAAVQQYLQDVVDSLGVGNAAAMPTFAELLSGAGLADTRDSGAMVTAYTDKNDQLDRLKATLISKDADVSGKTAEVSSGTRDTLRSITNLIEELKDKLRNPGGAFDAPTSIRGHAVDFNTLSRRGHAADSEFASLDRYVGATLRPETVQYLVGEMSACIHAVDTLRQALHDAVVDAGEHVKRQAPGVDSSKKAGSSSSSAGGDGSSSGGGTAGAGNGSSATDQSAALDDGSIFGDLLPSAANGSTTGASPTDPGSSTPITATPTSSTPARPSPQSPSGGSQSGGGGGGDSSMMSTVMMMASMVATQIPALITALSSDDSDRESKRRRHRDKDAEQDTPNTPQNPPTDQQPGSAVPATDPPPVTAPVTDAPPPDTTSVSPAVTEAVKRAKNFPNGCDARAAYAGTAGEESSSARWNPIDPNQAHTGDVALWANRSAVLVKQPSGLQMIFQGKLIDFDPHNVPSDFGKYNGCAHPSGLDAATQPQPPKPTPVIAARA